MIHTRDVFLNKGFVKRKNVAWCGEDYLRFLYSVTEGEDDFAVCDGEGVII